MNRQSNFGYCMIINKIILLLCDIRIVFKLFCCLFVFLLS